MRSRKAEPHMGNAERKRQRDGAPVKRRIGEAEKLRIGEPGKRGIGEIEKWRMAEWERKSTATKN